MMLETRSNYNRRWLASELREFVKRSSRRSQRRLQLCWLYTLQSRRVLLCVRSFGNEEAQIRGQLYKLKQ